MYLQGVLQKVEKKLCLTKEVCLAATNTVATEWHMERQPTGLQMIKDMILILTQIYEKYKYVVDHQTSSGNNELCRSMRPRE